MEIKIGIRETGREIVLESSQKAEEVTEAVRTALADEAPVLELTDEKGRLYLVPSKALAYIEIGPQETRKIGFVS
ncbi:DUF3107 domain-containing protein [Pseudoclavibacter soli]|uniref:DUF3107 domain-containing protein n=1 Tax=Pseudoclavibacter soli TaxID=452623 RepID=UPI000426E962|nr:DUF3107 domain-containing protein [Pseudoclavibacter soli]